MIAVAVGAAVGAVCRWLLDRAVGRPPWGVLLVNLLGCLAAGVVAGLAPGPDAVALVATGLLGGFTTASTLAVDVLRLVEQGRARTAVADLVLSTGPGLALGALGLLVGRAL